jgi:histidyl-tRNA synthetase
MRDLLPADVRKREYVIGIIKSVYESYGFEPLETPAVENLETLTGKYGEEGNQLIYKILKRGEKLRPEMPEKDLADLALRYDLTVPLARVVANRRNDLPKFFKRYQIQPVWRADRPAKGRYREFYQCDVDVIGSVSMLVEAELISAVSQILTRLGFNDFTVRINHRELLRDLLDTAGIPDSQHSDALIAIDKLDKIGVEGVGAELSSRGIAEPAARMTLDLFEQARLITEQGGDVNRTLMSNLINIVRPEVLTDIGRIIKFSGNSPVVIDPSLARGLSYYTGAIMEVNVPDLAGSLAGGGRYDELIGMFGKEKIPACGFSLGLERILVVMDERNMFPAEAARAAADVLVTIWNEDSIDESVKLANELRKDGLRVLLYPEADKLGKQIKYADSIGIPFVCVLGESELAENKVTLKNMKTGEQTSVSRKQSVKQFMTE